MLRSLVFHMSPKQPDNMYPLIRVTSCQCVEIQGRCPQRRPLCMWPDGNELLSGLINSILDIRSREPRPAHGTVAYHFSTCTSCYREELSRFLAPPSSSANTMHHRAPQAPIEKNVPHGHCEFPDKRPPCSSIPGEKHRLQIQRSTRPVRCRLTDTQAGKTGFCCLRLSYIPIRMNALSLISTRAVPIELD